MLRLRILLSITIYKNVVFTKWQIVYRTSLKRTSVAEQFREINIKELVLANHGITKSTYQVSNNSFVFIITDIAVVFVKYMKHQSYHGNKIHHNSGKFFF